MILAALYSLMLAGPVAAPLPIANTPATLPAPVKVEFEPAKLNALPSPEPIIKPPPATATEIAANPATVEFGNRLPLSIASDILNKDLEDFAQVLQGVWDNEIQTFFEPEIGIPQNARHTRLHVKIIPINAQGFGTKTFYAEYRQNGESGTLVRARVWSLNIAPAQMAISLRAFEPKSTADLATLAAGASKLNAIKLSDFTPLSGCDINFKRRANGFEGETMPGACKVAHSDGRILNVTERHFIGNDAWDVSDIGVDNRGQRVFGNLDDAPTHLRRAAIFKCWASFTQGNGNQLLSDLELHDQGGEVQAKFTGVATLRLRLRNIEWPIGTNRPSLTLYLLQGKEEFAQIYAWSDPDAKRIAVSYANFQASCTKQDN